MIPAFRFMGGKARMRAWLLRHFPKHGRHYVEPFAGVGNVFYAARTQLDFAEWLLADIAPDFLTALLRADLDALPEAVSREDFAAWKAARDGADPGRADLARLLEPRITFAGKGYAFGYSGSSGTHVGYSKRFYRPVCEAARALLAGPGVHVRQIEWEHLLSGGNPDDFVYLDPPYYGTVTPYPQIDHAALVERLNAAPFRWALSGYDNALYNEKLRYARRFLYERNSEIRSSNKGRRTPVIETLWTNYEPGGV